MGKILQLFDSRVSHLRWQDGGVEIHFSFAYIQPSHTLQHPWSQEVVMTMEHARYVGPLPSLPSSVVDGSLELDGVRHEAIVLPLASQRHAKLNLEFDSGETLQIEGEEPDIRLKGRKVFLNE